MRVRFEQVTKRFGRHVAADAVDLDVAAGECLVLVGPSGCGKTTLLRLLAGLEHVDGGRLWIGDRVVNDVPAADRNVAMVFQNYALYPHFTVFDNIAFPLRTRRVDRISIAERVAAAAERLGLSDLVERRPAQLSGGQQQRVALARALVRSPAVFLMDEPLSNLDAQLRAQTRAELKRLQQELKATTIYVTHDQAEAMTLGSRVAVMRQGRIVQIDAPMALYRNPQHVFVATFIGSPAMNLLDEVHGGRKVQIGVRPEDIHVSLAAQDGWEPASTMVVEPMGSETLLTLGYRSQRLVARVPGDCSVGPGQGVWIRLPPERLLYFNADSGLRIAD
jgi:multiple sugar transport system ATP-binding protein